MPTARPPPVEQLFRIDFRTIALTQMLDVCVIIMNADDIGGAAFPAVIADDRPGSVQRLGQVIQRFHGMPLLAYRGEFGHSPGLIEGNPHDDAGVAVVALDGFGPFAHRPLDGATREAVGGWHFLPHHEPQPVRPV